MSIATFIASQLRKVGVDFSPEMTALCAKRFDRFVRAGRLELRCADDDALPYPRHGFRLYEPEQVAELLGRAGFHDVRLVPGTTRLGPFTCAVGTR